MNWLRLLFSLSARRVRASRGPFLLIAASVLAAITLVATAAIYSQTLAEAGLRHSVASIAETSFPMRIAVRDRPLGRADYRRLRDIVEPIVADRIGWMDDHQHRYGRSQDIPTATEKEGTLEVRSEQAFLSFFTGFREKGQLVEGRWPEPAASSEGGDSLTLEVLVGPRTARRMNWQVGSTVLLLPYGTQYEERLNLRITGIVEPKDPSDVYWLGDLSHFDLMSVGQKALVPFIIEESAFFDSLGATYPTLLGSYWWRVFLNTDILTTSVVNRARRGIDAVDTDVNKALPRSSVLTGLASTLDGFKRRLQLAQVPLFLFTSLVLGVLLYFLALVMNLLVHNRVRVMTLLRGRGAGPVQAAALLTAGESVALVAAAIGLGPILGRVIVRVFLAKGLNPAGVESTASLVSLTPGVYLLAAIVGVVVFALLFLTGLSAARLHLADFLKERARPPGIPLVHRYYLDVLVLLILGVVLWQVHARGGFISEKLLGGLQMDATLLFGPAIALLAAGLVLLRVLPAILKVLAWLSEIVCPAWASLALKRMARDSVAHGLLAIIVMAAAALGTFAALFRPTLSQSQHDQVHYSTASDIVLREPLNRAGDWGLTQRLESLPGVKAVTTVHRTSGGLATAGSEPGVAVLALTPETLPETAWFRPDFSDKDLPELSDQIRSVPTREEDELTLPTEAESLGVWAKMKQQKFFSLLPLNLWARVADSQGTYKDLWLGEILPREEWLYMEAPLPEPGPYVHPPFRLVAIYANVTALSGKGGGTLYLDDVTVKGPGLPPQGVIVEGFEEERPWTSLPAPEEETSTLAWEEEAARSGEVGLEFSWPRRTHDAATGIILTNLPSRLPALGGPGFSPGQEIVLHTHRCLIPLTVQSTARYFPTMLSGKPFLIVNLKDYSRYLQEQPQCDRVGPTEYWVSRHAGADPAETLASVREEAPSRMTVEDRASVMASAVRDPLRPGSADITSLGIVVLAGVVLLGLVSYGAAFVERARVDLAVVRTLGFLRGHVVLSLLVERILIVLLGATTGWGLGVAMSRWALGYLGITPAGTPVVPPMLLVTDVGILATAFATIGGAAALALLLEAARAASLDVPSILRQEE